MWFPSLDYYCGDDVLKLRITKFYSVTNLALTSAINLNLQSNPHLNKSLHLIDCYEVVASERSLNTLRAPLKGNRFASTFRTLMKSINRKLNEYQPVPNAFRRNKSTSNMNASVRSSTIPHTAFRKKWGFPASEKLARLHQKPIKGARKAISSARWVCLSNVGDCLSQR